MARLFRIFGIRCDMIISVQKRDAVLCIERVYVALWNDASGCWNETEPPSASQCEKLLEMNLFSPKSIHAHTIIDNRSLDFERMYSILTRI